MALAISLLYFLKISHIVLLVGMVFLITLLHTIPAPFLNFLRIPKVLFEIDKYRYISLSYTASFQIYHSVLYFLLLALLINLSSFSFPSPLLNSFSTVFSTAGFLLSLMLIGIFLFTLQKGYNENLVRKGSAAYAVFFIIVSLLFLATLLVHEDTVLSVYSFISSASAGE